jgi:hypothetical protein
MARKPSGPSKMGLVREAFAKGITEFADVMDYLKQRGVINTGHVTNYNSPRKKEPKTPKPAVRSPRRPKKAAITSKSAPSGYADKVAQLKALIKELGADTVKKLVKSTFED